MKNRMILIFALFLLAPCVYSQHIAKVIEVEISLNSTKESAVKKLLNKGYMLSDSYEEGDNNVLKYKRTYYDYADNYGYYESSNRVWLYFTSGKVSKVTWDLHYGDQDAILKELKFVYDLKPYAEIGNDAYFYWKGYTMIVGGINLDILSNADAEKRLQKSNQKKIEQQQRLEKQKGQGQEQQGQRSLKELNEKLEMFRQQAEAKRKREADSIAHIHDSIAHIQELKENYSSCRFLFASEERFISCITQVNQNAIENEIKTLIGQKMAEISNVIVKGTEFKDQYRAKSEMDRICNIPNHMRNVSPAIANFTENKVIKFVADRKKHNNAYNRAKRKNPNVKCSEFLLTYIN